MSAKLLLAVMQTYAPTYLEEMLSPLLDRMLESPSMSYEVRKKYCRESVIVLCYQ